MKLVRSTTKQSQILVGPEGPVDSELINVETATKLRVAGLFTPADGDELKPGYSFEIMAKPQGYHMEFSLVNRYVDNLDTNPKAFTALIDGPPDEFVIRVRAQSKNQKKVKFDFAVWADGNPVPQPPRGPISVPKKSGTKSSENSVDVLLLDLRSYTITLHWRRVSGSAMSQPKDLKVLSVNPDGSTTELKRIPPVVSKVDGSGVITPTTVPLTIRLLAGNDEPEDIIVDWQIT